MRRLILCLLLFLVGCAPVLPEMHQPGEMNPTSVLFMKARIVDINEETSVLTVKESERYETWTVVFVASTRVRLPDGGEGTIADLRVGREIEIRGRSRVESLCTADEISILEERPQSK